MMYPPEDGAGDEARLGEGEEGDEEGCEDAEEEDVAELPPRGHDHRHLVVHQEHGQNLPGKYTSSFYPILRRFLAEVSRVIMMAGDIKVSGCQL